MPSMTTIGFAATLAVPARECVVIEDAEKGILAAAAAGMPSIAIPNPHTRDNDFSKATLLLPSLHALTLEVLSGAAALLEEYLSFGIPSCLRGIWEFV